MRMMKAKTLVLISLILALMATIYMSFWGAMQVSESAIGEPPGKAERVGAFSPLLLVLLSFPFIGLIGIQKGNRWILMGAALSMLFFSMLAVFGAGIIYLFSALLLCAASLLYKGTPEGNDISDKAASFLLGLSTHLLWRIIIVIMFFKSRDLMEVLPYATPWVLAFVVFFYVRNLFTRYPEKWNDFTTRLWSIAFFILGFTLAWLYFTPERFILTGSPWFFFVMFFMATPCLLAAHNSTSGMKWKKRALLTMGLTVLMLWPLVFRTEGLYIQPGTWHHYTNLMGAYGIVFAYVTTLSVVLNIVGHLADRKDRGDRRL